MEPNLFIHFEKNAISPFLTQRKQKNQCYYPHPSRDSVSPVCGILSQKTIILLFFSLRYTEQYRLCTDLLYLVEQLQEEISRGGDVVREMWQAVGRLVGEAELVWVREGGDQAEGSVEIVEVELVEESVDKSIEESVEESVEESLEEPGKETEVPAEELVPSQVNEASTVEEEQEETSQQIIASGVLDETPEDVFLEFDDLVDVPVHRLEVGTQNNVGYTEGHIAVLVEDD